LIDIIGLGSGDSSGLYEEKVFQNQIEDIGQYFIGLGARRNLGGLPTIVYGNDRSNCGSTVKPCNLKLSPQYFSD
jgi:hypothetical protein